MKDQPSDRVSLVLLGRAVGPRRCRRAVAWWGLIVLHLGLLYGEPPRYRGFTIDTSRVKNMPNLDAVRAATEEQIDLVCAVGVPAEVLSFFQSVPFEIVPPGTMRRRTPGLYVRNHGVRITAAIAQVGHKPVLLHELLHAYHDQKIAGGFKNPEIIRFYDHAQLIAAFGEKSHMMENNQEFFACSATTFLFGVTAQEPFKRERLGSVFKPEGT